MKDEKTNDSSKGSWWVFPLIALLLSLLGFIFGTYTNAIGIKTEAGEKIAKLQMDTSNLQLKQDEYNRRIDKLEAKINSIDSQLASGFGDIKEKMACLKDQIYAWRLGEAENKKKSDNTNYK